jgi:hypothetical protein
MRSSRSFLVLPPFVPRGTLGGRFFVPTQFVIYLAFFGILTILRPILYFVVRRFVKIFKIS